jgi:hypothetical protein
VTPPPGGRGRPALVLLQHGRGPLILWVS